MTLSWAPAALEELWHEAEQAAPREACGALLGKGDFVFMIQPLVNIEPGDDHYTIEPKELVGLYAWLDSLADDAMDVVAFYHSHAHTGSDPSELDRTLALPGLRYVIVSLLDRTISEFVRE